VIVKHYLEEIHASRSQNSAFLSTLNEGIPLEIIIREYLKWLIG
jgi:hypothetical protein